MAMKDTDADALVEKFADNVVKQTDATARGDARSGNKYAKRYIAAFEQLCSLGDQGRDALVVLLEHARADVRVMAAAFLLRHRTTEALAVLREASAGEGLIAFQAAQTIKRWEDGTWALDLASE